MAASENNRTPHKHIFWRLLKVCFFVLCLGYAINPHYTLGKIFEINRNAQTNIINPIIRKGDASKSPVASSAQPVSSKQVTSADNPVPEQTPDNAQPSPQTTGTPSDNFGEYEITGTAELFLRSEPTTQSDAIATMHQDGRTQGEKIVRLMPPDGADNTDFYYVAFTTKSGETINGWAGKNYLVPVGEG